MYNGLDWARFNVWLDTYLGHFKDGVVTTAPARIVAAAQPHSVCGIE